jgi:hypothetical protein
MNLEMIKQQQ